jgi:CRP/FNR family transcriptional regulator, anaerobic regulatory protein
MIYKEEIEKMFNYLGKNLLSELIAESEIKELSKGTELVRQGQYVKFVPIILHGLVKVYSQIEDKELLLYYIKPEESCIMSFSSCIHHETSKIFAITEEASIVLLIPAEMITKWIKIYPSINLLFYKQYDIRYMELVDSLNHILYYKLDRRLLDYLNQKVIITGTNPIKISHKEIARDLGTAREVISRLIKKMESNKILVQNHESIEILIKM